MTDTVDALTEQLEAHYRSVFVSGRMAELAEAFRRDHYVEIADFVPDAVWQQGKEEIRQLVGSAAVRRDVLMPTSDNSPRCFSSVGWKEINSLGNVIQTLYESAALQKLLCAIAGNYLIHPPHLPERYLITRMHKKGDTHGWHWDDYSYALIWLIECPPEGKGGHLQFVPGTTWNRDHPNIASILREHKEMIVEKRPRAGTAYLLRSDTSLHRVVPLAEDAERVVVSMAFALPDNLDAPIDHKSWHDLFPDHRPQLGASA